MNKLRGPSCPVCGRNIKDATVSTKQPVAIYENCKRCKRERTIFTITPLLVLLGYVLYVIIGRQFILAELGYVLGVVGALLLVNNLAKPFLAGIIWDGYKVVKKELPQIRRTNLIGFMLITLGFIASFATSDTSQVSSVTSAFSFDIDMDWFKEIFNNEVFLIVLGAIIAGAVAWFREVHIYRTQRKHDFENCLDEIIVRLEAASSDDLFQGGDKLIPTFIHAYTGQLKHISELAGLLPRYLTKLNVNEEFKKKVAITSRNAIGISLRSLENLEKRSQASIKDFKGRNQSALRRNLDEMREIKNEFESEN